MHGVIIRPDGHSLTNFQVVEDAVELRVTLSNGRHYEAEIVGELEEIPYPSFYNRHFTPDTTPAAPDGVYITDIVKQDGSVYFRIGYGKKVSTRKIEKRSDY